MTNKGKLSKTILKYFANTIGFSCRITPPPNTSLELDYLLHNFHKLAPLDNFPTISNSNHGFFINAIYSPCRDESWFKLIKPDENHLFEEIDPKTTSTVDDPFISIIDNNNANGTNDDDDDEVLIDYEKLRVNLRHNFQKFHKFDKIEIITIPNRLINRLK